MTAGLAESASTESPGTDPDVLIPTPYVKSFAICIALPALPPLPHIKRVFFLAQIFRKSSTNCDSVFISIWCNDVFNFAM